MAGKIVGLLFLSRDAAHKEHLRTRSYAQHIALRSFYDEVIDLADRLAEAYQGRNGLISIASQQRQGLSTPSAVKTDGDIVEVLKSHLTALEDMRYDEIDEMDTALQNIVDEIVGLYLSTLYKLQYLN